MGQSNVNLASLIGSRICHDLISPIGAIHNGLELMSMGAASPASPEMDLIGESVESANARIRFFRVAYGVASPDQTHGAAEVLSILAGVNKSARVQFSWVPDGYVQRPDLQAIFLSFQCIESAMPFGGIVDVCKTTDGWQVVGTAEKTNISAPLWAVLTAPESEVKINPADVQFALLPAVLQDRGRKPKVQIAPTQIFIEI